METHFTTHLTQPRNSIAKIRVNVRFVENEFRKFVDEKCSQTLERKLNAVNFKKLYTDECQSQGVKRHIAKQTKI